MKEKEWVRFRDGLACCGCSACADICPKGAIEIRENEEGTYYPYFNEQLCVGCGLCRGVCMYEQMKKKKEVNTAVPTFVAVNRNKEVLCDSSSGGVFSVIAESVLEEGGVVFGCAYDEMLTAIHIAIEKKEELTKLRGSKYMQSNMNHSYRQAKQYLEAGRTVLFTGTPCQISGLKRYLKKPYEQLITIDVICHGVASRKWFHEYLHTLRKKNQRICGFSFRDKSRGNALNAAIYYKKNNKITKRVIPSSVSSYYTLFLNASSYRESCYDCLYAGKEREGDLTLGDYWGVGEEHPELLKGKHIKEENGVSLLLVNSEQGRRVLKKVKGQLDLFRSSFEQASQHNKQLLMPSVRGGDYENVRKLYRQGGYQAVDEFFRKRLGKKRLYYYILMYIPKRWKEWMKRKL